MGVAWDRNFPSAATLNTGSNILIGESIDDGFTSLPSMTVHVSGSATLTPYVYVCDSGNDRIQVFDFDGNFLFEWGSNGSGDGQFISPYGVCNDGEYVYVTDTGNDRVQKFDLQGNYIGQWGSSGIGLGEFNAPYGISVDNRFVYVVENGNDRFQVFTKDGSGVVFILGEHGSGVDQFDGPTDCYVDSVYLWINDAGNGRIVPYLLNWVLNLDFMDADLPAFTVAADGAVRSGLMVADLPALTSSGSSSVNTVISVDVTLPAFTVDAFTAGRMVANIMALAGSGAGHATLTADMLASLPGLAVSGQVSVQAIITGDATLPALQILAAGLGGSNGSSLLTLPALIARSRGFGGQLSQMASELPPFTVAGVVLADVTAQGLLILPALEMVAYGHYSASGGTFEILAINTVNRAVTNYSNYPFNSLASFNGQLLMAGATGLFRETGGLDVTTDISAHIRTARMDFFAGYGDTPNILRKIREGWMVGRHGGDMRLTITDDELLEFVYDMGVSIGTEIADTRVKFARGMKGRFYDFKIENMDGSDFDIISFRVKAEGFPGRRR